MNKVFVAVVISDIHFGAIESNQLLTELGSEFIDKIEEMPIIDMIVIDGDLFDKKVSLNSNHSKAAFIFMSKVCEVAKRKNAKVRVVKGTLSHDNDQLDNLTMFTDICDFKVINYLETENIDGIEILYIPEEYIEDEEYFNKIYNGQYDLCFGHGMVKEASFVAHKQESAITMKRAPIFDTAKLLEAVKGVCMFGHIHTPMKIKKRFYYCGSFSRWCFGEEEDKGFNTIYYTPECPEKTKVEFIKNELAREYNTVTVDVMNDSVENVISIISDIVNIGSYYKKRIVINIGDGVENRRLMSDMINETFSKYSSIVIIINNLEKEKIRRQNDEKVEHLLSEYGFIFDKTISREEKIYKYINKKYNRNIPLDKIRNYLFNKIIE